LGNNLFAPEKLQNISLTEETDAAANTCKEGSLGEMKYKDDKRQEIWDK